MRDQPGRIVGIHQQISLAMIVAPDFKMHPFDFMDLLSKAGVKIVPDDSEIMYDAANVYKLEINKMKEEVNPKTKLKVVKNANSAEN